MHQRFHKFLIWFLLLKQLPSHTLGLKIEVIAFLSFYLPNIIWKIIGKKLKYQETNNNIVWFSRGSLICNVDTICFTYTIIIITTLKQIDILLTSIFAPTKSQPPLLHVDISCTLDYTIRRQRPPFDKKVRRPFAHWQSSQQLDDR